MTRLTDEWARTTHAAPLSLLHGDREITVRASTAESANYDAYLEIVSDGDVVGYLLQFGLGEAGVVPVRAFGIIAPQIVNSLEGAIDVLLPQSPRG